MPRWVESTRHSWLLSTNFPAKREVVRVLAWGAESEFDRGISLGAHPGRGAAERILNRLRQGSVAYDVSPTGRTSSTLNTVGNRFGLLPYGSNSTIPGLPSVVP